MPTNNPTPLVLDTPTPEGLGRVVAALGSWQSDAAPFQLHPGDLGWHLARGPKATAAALRTWSRDGEIVAVGFLDGPDLMRFTTAPEVRRSEAVALHVVADLHDPEQGALPAGEVFIEAPTDAVLHDHLQQAGWAWDELWTPLQRDLGDPVEPSGLRIETVDSDIAAAWCAVYRTAFPGSKFTAEHWSTMAQGIPFADARSLLGYDTEGTPVAIITVWSAGPGRPGIMEPVGVHQDHLGHGHGRAICIAAAAALQELGASSAMVATQSANVAAVATYAAAGYRKLPERRDQSRPAAG